ncbi:MAG: hypothetical protein D3923_15250 [Candidatus Electrothrix sp. AR3]|nr:hypothetical protein [Candidatus Electrothrix sp. AR3]
MFRNIILLLVIFLLPTISVSGENFIGGLRKVKGSGVIIRQGKQITAQNGVRVIMGDKLMTGEDGAMGVIFTDNTRISLGADTEISITRYIYNPRQGVFAFLTNMAQGTASYISGIMSKMAPDSVQLLYQQIW